MRTTRIVVLSLLGIVVAAVAGQIMCAPLKRGLLLSPKVFSFMLVFSCTSFAIFCVTKNMPSPLPQLAAGIGSSYLAFLGIVFIFAAIKDEVAEAILWLPAMLLFGIPLMAPLVGLSWLGSTLVSRVKRR